MRSVPIFATLVLILCTAGCVSNPPNVEQREHRNIPAALLEECDLPSLATNNGEGSEALVQAYQCAQQGNKDKAEIKKLISED